MTAEIITLPYSVTRRIGSRKPRRSKNGTPEERAAKAAKEGRPAPPAPVLKLPGSTEVPLARVVERADEICAVLDTLTPDQRSAVLRVLEVLQKN